MKDSIAIGTISCAVCLLLEWGLNWAGFGIYLHPVFYAGIFVGNVVFHTSLAYCTTSENKSVKINPDARFVPVFIPGQETPVYFEPTNCHECDNTGWLGDGQGGKIDCQCRHSDAT